MIESTTSQAVDGDDRRRADQAEAADAYDPKAAREAALDSIPWGPVNDVDEAIEERPGVAELTGPDDFSPACLRRR